MQTPAYRTIELETWPRREHFRYYREAVVCGYSLTSRVDVTETLAYARRTGRRFYGCFLFALSQAVNGMDEMKLMLTPDGAPGIWEVVHPSFTVFHEDDKTFSDLWTAYDPDFPVFYEEFARVLAQYGDCHGIKGRPGQPANFFCASCVPWMDYTGYATHTAGAPALFPIFTFGRYTQTGNRFTLPVTLTIGHAAADGYHASLLFRRLEESLRAFGALPVEV